MSDHGDESSDGGGGGGGGTKGAADGGSQSGKKAAAAAAAAASYSGVVAQRALYGSYKRRAGRRVVSKSAPPSRLSKVSATDGNGS